MSNSLNRSGGSGGGVTHDHDMSSTLNDELSSSNSTTAVATSTHQDEEPKATTIESTPTEVPEPSSTTTTDSTPLNPTTKSPAKSPTALSAMIAAMAPSVFDDGYGSTGSLKNATTNDSLSSIEDSSSEMLLLLSSSASQASNLSSSVVVTTPTSKVERIFYASLTFSYLTKDKKLFQIART